MTKLQTNMSKDLTKNARWIVYWMRLQSNDTLMFKPYEVVMNLGRYPYDVPEEQAFREHIDVRDDRLLAHKSFLVDVALFPYAKQHKEVTKLAENYFSKQRIVT